MIESALLDFENVRKVYKDFELHVNLKVEPGYITGLIHRADTAEVISSG